MKGRLRPPKPLADEDAREYALRLLGRRAYTVAELRERLARRGAAGPAVDALLSRLVEVGLLDDATFARDWVAGRGDRRGAGMLRHELGRKGVADEHVEGALRGRDEEKERTAATQTLRAHAWRYRTGDDEGEPVRQRAAARAFAMLARRGFDPDAARAAVEAVLGGVDDES